MAGRLALELGIACNLGGGTHHAFPDYGAGFCIFNDVSVALRQLRAESRVRRALIVDLDVHQGDGTAWIHREEPEIFTFSPGRYSSLSDVKIISGIGAADNSTSESSPL